MPDIIKNLIKILNEIFAWKKLLHCFLVAIVPASVFYCLSIIVLKLRGFEIMEILRDPAQQSGASSFLGFLSNIGIWLWICSAAISFFFVLTRDIFRKKNFRELLFFTGVLSILLAVDDFFLIHDRYVNQNICYLTYVIFIGYLLIRHFKRIIAIDVSAFLLTGIFLALSIFTDLIQTKIPLIYEYVQIIEEGFKFIGAAIWLYFNGRIASYLLVSATERLS